MIMKTIRIEKEFYATCKKTFKISDEEFKQIKKRIKDGEDHDDIILEYIDLLNDTMQLEPMETFGELDFKNEDGEFEEL